MNFGFRIYVSGYLDLLVLLIYGEAIFFLFLTVLMINFKMFHSPC